jgi:transglutaminase-like putative cysteine protease
MSKFTIHHSTIYTYQTPVYDGANQIMLFPIRDEQQEILEHQLKITNEPLVDTYIDYYGNEVGTFTTKEYHKELKIDSIMVVEIHKKALPEISIFIEKQWTNLKQLSHQLPHINFLKQEVFSLEAEVYQAINPEQKKTNAPYQVAKNLNSYVYENFKYIKGITNVSTTVEEIWKLKAGVCQDFAHILLVMLRYMGIPARYVSGYICGQKNEMRGEGATHAWVEAYLPDYGWLGLDPTNNCIVDDLHVKLAIGRNFEDCSPVKGTYKGSSKHRLEVKVNVSYEDDTTQFRKELETEIEVDNTPVNSYRRFVEMQQQQQQQQ